MNIRLGVIFDGGGFTGAYSLGYAKAIYTSGLRPICCQGVSVGSLTGASCAEKNGNPEEAEQTWLKIGREGPSYVFPTSDIPRRIFRKISLFSNKGIYRLTGSINYQKLINSEIRFDTIVYNETTSKQEIFSSSDERCVNDPLILKNAIAASCSLRGFLEPVLIDGNFYSDGISFIIKPLAQMGCNTIFILLNESAENSARTDEKWWLWRLLAGIASMNNLLEDKEIESAENANHNIATLNGIIKEINTFGIAKHLFFRKTINRFRFTFENKQLINIILFRPMESVPTLHTLGFEKSDIPLAIANGYESGSHIIENFLKKPV